MCHWGPSIWCPLRYLSDHGDEVNGDESAYEATEVMPPLPPDSWFKSTDVLREVSETLQRRTPRRRGSIR